LENHHLDGGKRHVPEFHQERRLEHREDRRHPGGRASRLAERVGEPTAGDQGLGDPQVFATEVLDRVNVPARTERREVREEGSVARQASQVCIDRHVQDCDTQKQHQAGPGSIPLVSHRDHSPQTGAVR
jgi:hypothetical protein